MEPVTNQEIKTENDTDVIGYNGEEQQQERNQDVREAKQNLENNMNNYQEEPKLTRIRNCNMRDINETKSHTISDSKNLQLVRYISPEQATQEFEQRIKETVSDRIKIDGIGNNSSDIEDKTDKLRRMLKRDDVVYIKAGEKAKVSKTDSWLINITAIL